MAETNPPNPFETSYAEHPLKYSVTRNAAKRLRKEASGRGNRARQEFEAKAPRWTNEESALKGTSNSPSGHSVNFQAGANPGPFKLGFPGATIKPKKG